MSENKKPVNALQAVLDQQTAKNIHNISQPMPLQTKEPSKKNTKVVKEDMATYSRPSRTGKRLIGGHFPPEIAKHLKILAAEEDTSIQSLLEEALDLLFVKKGKGHINRA